jgi:hypothetical protein
MVAPINTILTADTPRPKDVGILAMEMYFPRRVSLLSFLTTPFIHGCVISASLRKTSKFSMVSQRASILLALARNTCPAVMTVKTSTPLL